MNEKASARYAKARKMITQKLLREADYVRHCTENLPTPDTVAKTTLILLQIELPGLEGVTFMKDSFRYLIRAALLRSLESAKLLCEGFPVFDLITGNFYRASIHVWDTPKSFAVLKNALEEFCVLPLSKMANYRDDDKMTSTLYTDVGAEAFPDLLEFLWSPDNLPPTKQP
jgi:hypothetical protein